MSYPIFRVKRTTGTETSVAVSAEISSSHPENYLFLNIKKNIYRIKVSKKEINLISKKTSLTMTGAHFGVDVVYRIDKEVWLTRAAEQLFRRL